MSHTQSLPPSISFISNSRTSPPPFSSSSFPPSSSPTPYTMISDSSPPRDQSGQYHLRSQNSPIPTSHRFPFNDSTASSHHSRSSSPSPQDTLTLRALVSTKEAGIIIGKAGKNVADLREQTGVKAGVSKVIAGVHERVLTVTGPVESVSKVCLGSALYENPVKFFNASFRPTPSLFRSS